MARCEFGPKPRVVGEGLSRPPGWEGRLQSPAGEGRPSLGRQRPPCQGLKEGSVGTRREEELALVCMYQQVLWTKAWSQRERVGGRLLG